MVKKSLSALSVTLIFFMVIGVVPVFASNGPITWGTTATVTNINTFTDAGPDARGIRPGTFGSEYPRMLKLANGNWLAVAAIYDNNGYTKVSWGGTRLQVFRSTDNCRTWSLAATLWEDGRDLDNGQLAQLPNGDILLAMRSVRWQESYQLKVYKSTNGGSNWSYLSTIDENNGTPGSLGNPDKGVYEPHMGFLNDGSLAVMYANEKHVTENPSYSQIISEKISTNGGASWGSEIFVAWDPGNSASRPGMPVWTKMANGQYIVSFEVCGTQGCNIFYKKSGDGKTWSSGIGTKVSTNQHGGPYIISLTDGRLVLSSNSNVISISNDFGNTWYDNDVPAFGNTLWGAIYQTAANEIAFIDSVDRSVGGHNIQVRFGTLTTAYTNDFASNDNGWVRYGGSWNVSGGTYNLTSGSADKSVLTPYPSGRNYTLEGDIKLNNAGQGSLIFNVTNPSTGTDSLKGYGAGIDTEGLVWLGRFNNNWTPLSTVNAAIAVNTWYHMKVVVNNGNIKVYVGDMTTPKISFDDATYTNGTVGVRGGFGNSVSFDNIKVNNQ
ncbi:family 16 glycoside hydrolase [Paenibacillus hamazuiensis]|uniref:family 16 glycoside hydrolase n=1 Tax=Paenibacillus hamazuiensis TaxID=2936508 RepID=UPI00200BAB2E|nr:family 16 glycoside hydrolase [Paenibacillus hamazuiensis]